MPTSKQDQRHFQARIKSIKNPKNNFYYDPDLGMHIPKKVSKSQIKKAKAKDSAIGAVIVSLIIGGLAMLFGEAVRIRYFELPNWSDEGVYIQFFLAFWAMLFLSAIMDRRQSWARMAQLAGLLLIALAGHNLVWQYPDAMVRIYGSEHVAWVQGTTEPMTVVAMGNAYGIPELSDFVLGTLGLIEPDPLANATDQAPEA